MGASRRTYTFAVSGRVLGLIENLQLRRAPAGESRNAVRPDLFYEMHWNKTEQNARLSTAAVVNALGSKSLAVASEFRLDRYKRFRSQLDIVVSQYILNGFHELGCGIYADREFSLSSLMSERRIQGRHERLVARLLELLVEDRSVQRVGTGWRFCCSLNSRVVSAASLLTDFPEFSAEIVLTDRCGINLASVLRGATDPLELLFPGGSLEITQKLYIESPCARASNTMLAEALKKASSQGTSSRTLRILEIGAGTGGTTTYVVPVLPSDRTEYVYTDVSPLF